MSSAQETFIHADESQLLVLRSIISSREAGIIIGKAGKNVANLRTVTGVKAGVSKVVPGNHERILTITGEVDQCAKAFGVISNYLIDNPPTNPNDAEPATPAESANIHLLVSHHLMGSIIGKGGSRIREISEQSGAKIIIAKEMLSQSTERIIDIFGLADSIQIAVHHIGDLIFADVEKAVGTILYAPQSKSAGSRGLAVGRSDESRARAKNSKPLVLEDSTTDGNEVETRSIPIHVGLVGCIIGKGGEFINKIRSESGSRVSISKYAEAESNQRIFTVIGSKENNVKALSMLFVQLDAEKEKRLADIAAEAEASPELHSALE